MKNCVYRFLNKDNEIIYVGKAKDLKNRMNGHCHLPEECYKEREKIEYVVFKTEDDMNFAERYYIMKFNPKYNTVLADKDFSISSLELDLKEWVLYSLKQNIISKEVIRENIKDVINQLKKKNIEIETLRPFVERGKGDEIEVRYRCLTKEYCTLRENILEEIVKKYKVGEVIAEKFIKYEVFTIEELRDVMIKKHEDEYYIKCKKQIQEKGYYKEEVWEEMFHELFTLTSEWEGIFEGTKLYRSFFNVKKEIAINVINKMRENIHQKLCTDFGTLQRDVIITKERGVNEVYENILNLDKPYIIYRKIK